MNSIVAVLAFTSRAEDVSREAVAIEPQALGPHTMATLDNPLELCRGTRRGRAWCGHRGGVILVSPAPGSWRGKTPSKAVSWTVSNFLLQIVDCS